MPRFLAQLDEKATFPVKPLCSRWLFHYGMNVAQLREALASLPDDLDVFIVDDGEVFSPTLTPGELTSNNVRIQDEDRAMLAQREADLDEEALRADYTEDFAYWQKDYPTYEDFARWVHETHEQDKIQINTARPVVFLVR